MKHTSLFCALLCAVGSAHAADGLTMGVGVDYSSGDYGSDITTEIFSVPVGAKYVTGDWTFKASLPWVHVSGDPNVLPGVGAVNNTNPNGRGRGHGHAPPPPGEPETGTASGVGDLRLAATYSFDTGGPLGIDLTGNVKVATADEDKGLGTGANDYGVALDLYRTVGGATVFGGAGYTVLGDSTYIDVDAVGNVNFGASWHVGANGSLGAMYDWRQSAADDFDDRSEVTGFYSFGEDAGRWQVYALAGLSDGSPDWGGGVSYRHGF